MLSDTAQLDTLWDALRANDYFVCVHIDTGKLIAIGLLTTDEYGYAVIGDVLFQSVSTDRETAIGEFIAWQMKQRLSGENTNG